MPSVLLDARPLAAATGARGVGAYVRGLIEGLRALGDEAPPLALLATPGDPRALALDAAAIPFAHPPGPDLLWARISGPAAIRASGARLYHATFLAPLRAPQGVPTVATIHDVIPLLHPESFSLRQRLVFRLSLRCNSRAERVVAVSHHTAGLVTTIFQTPGERIRVVPPPVPALATADADERQARVDGPHPALVPPYVLHMSGFDPQKGVADLLLPAFAGLVADSRHAALRLVLTGPPSPWRDAAETAARDLGLAERVVFAGLLDDDERARALTHAAALVVSSREEGFGIPAIEGLAFGLPVAVGPAEATREAVGDHGFLAPDRTPAGLAHALARALAAPSAQANEAAARRAHAARFSPSAIARSMVAVYREILA